jgi:hypothetical protein
MYKLVLWNSVLEKLTFNLASQEVPSFSQQSTVYPCPDPDELSPHLPAVLP